MSQYKVIRKYKGDPEIFGFYDSLVEATSAVRKMRNRDRIFYGATNNITYTTEKVDDANDRALDDFAAYLYNDVDFYTYYTIRAGLEEAVKKGLIGFE